MKLISILLLSILLCNNDAIQYKTVEITTNSGNILLGKLIDENNEFYKIRTFDGIDIEIPVSNVKNIEFIIVESYEGKVYRADKNKSMYLFAPSAYAIGNRKSYIRDFEIFFLTYNRGIGNKISLQFGGLVLPIPVENIPFVSSIKYSFSKDGDSEAQFASGLLYMTSASADFSGMGLAFSTVTFGDFFNHYSASLGLGYLHEDGDWKIAKEPMFVLSGNTRISNIMALTYEVWRFPETDFEDTFIAISGRFIGRKISTDLGGMFTPQSLGDSIPFPLLNFTYHF